MENKSKDYQNCVCLVIFVFYVVCVLFFLRVVVSTSTVDWSLYCVLSWTLLLVVLLPQIVEAFLCFV